MSALYAFPQGNEWMDHEGNMRLIHEGGMTLRDYFAGQAIIGIMSTAAAFDRVDRRIDMVARKAYEFADAMLVERKSHEADRAFKEAL